MESAEDPALPPAGLVKTEKDEQVEYANGRPTRYLPGVSIIGQPAIQTRRGKETKILPEFPSLGQGAWSYSQPSAPPSLRSLPGEAINTHYEDGWPLPFSVPQEGEVSSLYQAPMVTGRRPQSSSLLAHIANQICNGS